MSDFKLLWLDFFQLNVYFPYRNFHALGFNYHIPPVLFLYVWLQWDSSDVPPWSKVQCIMLTSTRKPGSC